MCDRGCGSVLKGSKLGEVFSSLKQKELRQEAGLTSVQHSPLTVGLLGDIC